MVHFLLHWVDLNSQEIDNFSEYLFQQVLPSGDVRSYEPMGHRQLFGPYPEDLLVQHDPAILSQLLDNYNSESEQTGR